MKPGSYHGCVSDSHDKTVFRRGITILGLCNESFAGIVVGFAFPTLHSELFFECVPFSGMERV